MTDAQKNFIEQIAAFVKKHAPSYGIKVYSPIIAQAILESGWGTTNKVFNNGEYMHNYFGLKWRDGRCAISNDYFEEWTAEQNADGSYVNIVSRFYRFKSMEDCVIGYLQFTDIPNYANLKGVTDPREYLERIKADGYATSLKYVENNMRIVEQYDLTQYDEMGNKKMIFNVHAGHNPDGMPGCGAIGLVKESTENRMVKNEVIRLLRLLGHTVYDCTVDNGTSSNDVLKKIVSKCNEHKVDVDVSIHFNSSSKTYADNENVGTEAWVYNANSKAMPYAQKIVSEISKLGYTNRGAKTNMAYYVLCKTMNPAIIIECCFVNSKCDVSLYNYKTMAEAIVFGLTGQRYTEVPDIDTKVEESSGDEKKAYRVQVGYYENKTNAENMKKRLKEAGFDAIIVNA